MYKCTDSRKLFVAILGVLVQLLAGCGNEQQVHEGGDERRVYEAAMPEIVTVQEVQREASSLVGGEIVIEGYLLIGEDGAYKLAATSTGSCASVGSCISIRFASSAPPDPEALAECLSDPVTVLGHLKKSDEVIADFVSRKEDVLVHSQESCYRSS